MRSSLQSRIAAAMWIMTAVCTFVSAISAAVLLVNSHKESLRQQMQATATSLVSLGITHFSELKDFTKMNRFIEDALQMDRIDKVIRIYDGNRRLIYTTAGTDYDKLPDKLTVQYKKPTIITVKGRQRRYESLVMPYKGEDSEKNFYLQVAIPLPKYSDMLENLWWQIILLVGFLIGLSILLSQWVTRRLLAPVGVIAGHLNEMDPTRVDEWKTITLDPKSGYLKSIADGINLLAERTRAAISQLKKMSRYVAHEMRTPLTILQGEAETVLLREDAKGEDYERVLKSSLEEIQRMSEIVNTVLRVGEDVKVAPFHQPVSFDLVMWLKNHKGQLEKSLERPFELDVSSVFEAWVHVDPKLLYRLLDNLVRNVKNHTPLETKCRISVETNEGTRLLIEDEGGGLKQNIIDSLNEEGVSSDAAGIGLNLCYRIAQISGLSLIFANRRKGGLKVEIGF